MKTVPRIRPTTVQRPAPLAPPLATAAPPQRQRKSWRPRRLGFLSYLLLAGIAYGLMAGNFPALTDEVVKYAGAGAAIAFTLFYWASPFILIGLVVAIIFT
jgi:hypothetical protein